jgi:hypothetical protein
MSDSLGGILTRGLGQGIESFLLGHFGFKLAGVSVTVVAAPGTAFPRDVRDTSEIRPSHIHFEVKVRGYTYKRTFIVTHKNVMVAVNALKKMTSAKERASITVTNVVSKPIQRVAKMMSTIKKT